MTDLSAVDMIVLATAELDSETGDGWHVAGDFIRVLIDPFAAGFTFNVLMAAGYLEMTTRNDVAYYRITEAGRAYLDECNRERVQE